MDLEASKALSGKVSLSSMAFEQIGMKSSQVGYLKELIVSVKLSVCFSFKNSFKKSHFMFQEILRVALKQILTLNLVHGNRKLDVFGLLYLDCRFLLIKKAV